MRPSLWTRLALVAALVAMNFMAAAGSAMAGSAHAPATLAAQSHASTIHHHQHAAHQGHAVLASSDESTGECPSHRHGKTGDSGCCAAGCLMLGLPADLMPTLASDAGAVFLLPLPQFVASATSAHLRPPRA
jgi:hypothetical protein